MCLQKWRRAKAGNTSSTASMQKAAFIVIGNRHGLQSRAEQR
ncbi:hypothetical protein O206_15425 [Ochrobactrum sp. EGD-AQ16]|nr:hypothetical protein O206_15425 [Ochrobactrum sp. EGD-AQ16]